MGIIYTIYCIVTGKFYVGQTWETLRQRWNRHKFKATHGDTSCRYLYAAIRKHGVDNFDVLIRTAATNQSELDDLERQWIKTLRSDDRRFGYNLKSGGSAGKHNEETKRRMSATHKAHPNSGTFKKGHGAPKFPFTPGHIPWNKGLRWDEEKKKKASAAKLGKPWSEKRRAAHKSVPPDAHRLAIMQKMRDVCKANREAHPATHCSNGHELIEVNCIASQWAKGSKKCLICSRARSHRYYWKQKNLKNLASSLQTQPS